MAKITLTNDDGSTADFFDQATLDAAVAAAKTPAPTATEVDVVTAEGTEKFVPEA